jgi:hypothetical protein
MNDDPELGAIADALIRKHLSELLGWEEGMADQYVTPLRQGVFADLAKAGYVIKKETK